MPAARGGSVGVPLLVVALLAPALAAGPPEDAWPTIGGGPERVGVRGEVPPAGLPAVAWTSALPIPFPHFGRPAVAGGLVLLGARDGDVVALDAGTGAVAWSARPGTPLGRAPSLVVADGRVFASAEDGTVLALGLRDGARLWNVSVSALPLGSPTVAGGLVLVGSEDGNVTALDAASGEARWRVRVGDVVYAPPAVRDGVAYASAHAAPRRESRYAAEVPPAGFVAALDLETGRALWNRTTPGGFSTLVAASDDLVLAAFAVAPGALHALDRGTGATRWSYAAPGGGLRSPVAAGDLVLASGDEGGLFALDAASGTLRWRFDAVGPLSSAAVAGELVLVTSELYGGLHALDRGSGALVWKYVTDRTGLRVLATTSPVVSEGRVVFAVADGIVRAVDLGAASGRGLRVDVVGIEPEAPRADAETRRVLVVPYARVRNVGEEAAHGTAFLRVNGFLVDQRTVTVPGGASVDVAFRQIPLTVGDNSVEAGADRHLMTALETVVVAEAADALPEKPRGFRADLAALLLLAGAGALYFLWPRRPGN